MSSECFAAITRKVFRPKALKNPWKYEEFVTNRNNYAAN